jgi:hypothetical protein
MTQRNMTQRIKSLIHAYSVGQISSADFQELERILRIDDAVREQFLHEMSIRAALEDVALEDVAQEDVAFGASDSSAVEEAMGEGDLLSDSLESSVPRNSNSLKWTLAFAAIAATLLMTAYLLLPSGDAKIAKITGLSGPLQWTGNGGRTASTLSVGTELSGGTIEGMSPASWFELEFYDGSTFMISGTSMLTFSEVEQKELFLKSGSFSASVVPQRKPMLVHTRSAVLEVLGTQFEVEADRSETILNVSEGKVRLKRLSDGDSVVVPANHRVVASSDREMSLVPVPAAVHQWKSQLHLGPNRTHGEWSNPTNDEPAKLSAVPYNTKQNKTIYTTALKVSAGDNPPVVLKSNSKIRVRGRLSSEHLIYFGMTLRQPNGEFAGRFQTIRPAENFTAGTEFDILLDLSDYRLDPSLNHVKSRLPDEPFNLIVDTVWCHTLYDQVGLTLTEVELSTPEAESQADE